MANTKNLLKEFKDENGNLKNPESLRMEINAFLIPKKEMIEINPFDILDRIKANKDKEYTSTDLTQGDWFYNEYETEFDIIDENQESVLNFDRYIGVFANENQRKECLANAVLLASAPQLLKALQGLLKCYESDFADFNTIEIAKNKARKAIKQATNNI